MCMWREAWGWVYIISVLVLAYIPWCLTSGECGGVMFSINKVKDSFCQAVSACSAILFFSACEWYFARSTIFFSLAVTGTLLVLTFSSSQAVIDTLLVQPSSFCQDWTGTLHVQLFTFAQNVSNSFCAVYIISLLNLRHTSPFLSFSYSAH